MHHPLLNPHPRRPRQHLSHHQIRTHTTVSPLSPPFHINANASAITHNSPNLRIKTRATAPYPLSPVQSNSNTSSVADCFREPCVNTSRHAMSLCPPFFQVTSLLKYVISVQYQNIYISSSYPFPNIQYYKACNSISVFSGSSIILFKFFCKNFKYFQC